MTVVPNESSTWRQTAAGFVLRGRTAWAFSDLRRRPLLHRHKRPWTPTRLAHADEVSLRRRDNVFIVKVRAI
jgi:hypothetical protein